MNEFDYKPGVIDRVIRTLDHHIGRLVGAYRLRALDVVVLNKFAKALPGPAAKILMQQMKMFNHCPRWRSRAGSESTFSYYRGLGFKDIEPALRLKFDISHHMPVASARISAQGAGSNTSARVDLFTFGGEFESLKFDLSPKKIFGSYNPPINQVLISDVKVLFDPMNPNPFPTSPSNDFAALPEWIQSRIAGCPETSVSTPLSADLRDKLINYYDLPFPDDYLDLVSAAEYVGCPDSFEIYGLSKIPPFMSPRYYMFVLGEVFGAGILAVLRNAAPGVYFVDQNLDHIAMHMGNSLKVALYRALDEGEDKIIETSKEYNE
ncbi:MAG: hypothetical protein GYA46_09920 [candidate division Zixibacteria bacterium]|nr:hypothetical protein [candidate division Zixibacteria bacterium]